MLKRTIALTLVAIMLFSALPLGASAAPAKTYSANGITIEASSTNISADMLYITEGYGSLRIYDDGQNSPQHALIDSNGNFVFNYGKFPCMISLYDGVFSNGIVEGVDDYGDAYGTYSLFDLSGKRVTSDSYDYLKYYNGYGYVINESDSAAFGFDLFMIDKTGKKVMTLPQAFGDVVYGGYSSFEFEYVNWPYAHLGEVGGYSDGLFWFYTGIPIKNNLNEANSITPENMKYEYYDGIDYGGENSGFMDINGKVVIPQKYDSVSAFSEGLARVEGNLQPVVDYGTTYMVGKLGFIDKTGKVVIDFKYDDAGSFQDGLTYVGNYNDVSGDWNYGYIDKTGKVVVPMIYDDAFGAGGGFCTVGNVTQSGEYKYGYTDATGNVIVPLEYDDVSAFQNGVAYAIRDGKVEILKIVETKEQPSDWAKEYVLSATELGIVPEALQSKYTSATTREEFCALAVSLYEKLTGSAITARAEFSDTTNINVQKMAGLNVVNGIGDGKFDPTATLTREQAATMLARFADALGKPFAAHESTFVDKDSFADWSTDKIGQVQGADIMNGVGDNRFAPAELYSREQSITTMLRMYNVMK